MSNGMAVFSPVLLYEQSILRSWTHLTLIVSSTHLRGSAPGQEYQRKSGQTMALILLLEKENCMRQCGARRMTVS